MSNEIDESEVGKRLITIIKDENGIKVSGGGVMHNKLDELIKRMDVLIIRETEVRDTLREILNLRRR